MIAIFHDAPLRRALIIWLLFSWGYLFIAWFKPFHVDEFYSWMYTWRCSFSEILLLREFGIGHPPLYHLLQKCVQALMPSYHPIFVRAANYFIGSVFVVLISTWGLKQKRAPLFFAGICLSATVFETFIFSRMWGLVLLAVLLLYLAGERCMRTGTLRDLSVFGVTCLFALASDYGSSIVVIPYAAFVLIVRTKSRHARPLSALVVAALTLTWLLTTNRSMAGAGLLASLLRAALDFGTVVLKTLNTLFNFWFFEPLAIALIVFGIVACLEYAHRRRSNVSERPVLLSADMTHLLSQVVGIFDIRKEVGRLTLTILSAWLILLTVSPVFPRTLLNKKYLVILLPLYFVGLVKSLRPRLLNVLALVFLTSGGIYLLSNRIVEWYPPQVFDVPHPVVFENEFAGANHYLRHGLVVGEEPVLADFSMFERYCQSCQIGTGVLETEGVSTLQFVGFERPEAELAKVFAPPPDFVLTRVEGVRLTWLDQLQFKYLTPIPKQRFLVYTYVRMDCPAK